MMNRKKGLHFGKRENPRQQLSQALFQFSRDEFFRQFSHRIVTDLSIKNNYHREAEEASSITVAAAVAVIFQTV